MTTLDQISRGLRTATKKDRPALVSAGVRIAKVRQVELIELARKAPSRALNRMMSLDALAALPPEIRAISEQPFNAVGSIDLRWATSIQPDGSLDCKHTNIAVVGDETFEVVGAAFQDARQPIIGVPLNGYVVGELLVLEETGVQPLTAPEIAVSDGFFPDAAEPEIDPYNGRTADPAIAAVVGGKVYHFENQASIDRLREALVESTAVASTSESKELTHNFEWLRAEADGDAVGTFSFATRTPFQNDNLNVLFIRADFPDLTGAPVTKAVLDNSLAEARTRIQKFSYGKATFNFTVTPKVYRLSTNANKVAKDGLNDTIIEEARAAVTADLLAGYNLSTYDVVAVFFPSLSDLPSSKITYGGLATVGGSSHWINGLPEIDHVPILLHEFGHNYGLYHANYFNPARSFTEVGDEYLDPNQSSFEYGDIFDRMGDADENKGYFSPYATFRLDWMPSSKIVEPAASGTFRVHRFDDPAAINNSTLALRIPMGGERYNWVGLRQLFPETAGKAYVVGEGIYTDRPNLIDTTPNSLAAGEEDRSDAALPTGRNFYDPTGGVKITNTGSGGSAPNEYIDVKVDFDPRMEFSSTNVLVEEAGGNAAVMVKRGFSSVGACSVRYSTTDGTAKSGSDYHSSEGIVSWANGDSSPKTIFIPIRLDNKSEGTEAFTVHLSSPTNGVVVPSRSVATVRIIKAGNQHSSFSPPFFNLTVNAIVPLSDGKVIAGGEFTTDLSGNIVRFNADGSEDKTFTKGTGFNGVVNKILRQSDGKLVVLGAFNSYDGKSCPNIARLDANGVFDTAFVTALGIGANNTIRTIIQLPDGNLLLGGSFSLFNGVLAPGLARLSPTGAKLPFSPLFTIPTSIIPQVYDMELDPNGKVVIVGQFAFASGVSGIFKFSIARLNTDGTLDNTFNPGFGAHGAGVTNSAGFLTKVASTRINGAVKYLVFGYFGGYNGVNTPSSVIMVDSDGKLNPTFAPGNIDGQVNSFFTDRKGRILMAGGFSTPGNRVAALQGNGLVDASLNFGGGTSGSFIETIVGDSAGNVYFGGNFFDFGGSSCRPIVKIAGGLDSYFLWESGMFTDDHRKVGKTAQEEDFDGDGILNITEMALGTSPTEKNSPESFAVAAGNISLQSGEANSKYLQATMQRSADNVGVWLVAQFSSDLKTWLPSNPTPGSNADYEVTESTNGRFTVKDKTASAPGLRRFVRFRAVAPD